MVKVSRIGVCLSYDRIEQLYYTQRFIVARSRWPMAMKRDLQLSCSLQDEGLRSVDNDGSNCQKGLKVEQRRELKIRAREQRVVGKRLDVERFEVSGPSSIELCR